MENEMLLKILEKLEKLDTIEGKVNDLVLEQSKMREEQNQMQQTQNKILITVEKMENDDKLLAEGIQNINDKLDTAIKDIRKEFNDRIDVIERVVKSNSEEISEIKKDALLTQEVVAKNSLDIIRLKKAE